jgi:HD superfamily phosphohydrolase
MNYNSNEINFSQNSILSNINPSQSPLIHNEGFYSNLSLNQNINKNSLFDINNNINSKIIFDPIHDYITFPSKLWEIIDTSEFQRLRRLKQLSTVCYIFNGGNHTRFEHCIGTGFLSQDLIKRIFKKINIKNNNNEIEYIINSVSIAGLCHDIAHGPFSHLFNTILNRLNLNCVFDHEIFSKNIIEYLIDNNNIEDIDKDMINLISSLITGVPLTDSNVKSSIIEDYSFIYQIVANKLNSIDVDKFDYIVRDIYHLGISNLSVDYKRVYNDINIIDNKICFSEIIVFNVFTIFF